MRIEAIAPDELAAVRRSGRDCMGNPLRISVTEEAGASLRCCLRPARAGERIALIAHRPLVGGGPYAEVGPVFVHAEACDGYARPGEYPAEFRDRRQVFRPYDAAGDMVYDAIEIADGVEAEPVLTRILARPDVAVVHSRNLLAGCYMFAVRRA